jgi:hypothetical protein
VLALSVGAGCVGITVGTGTPGKAVVLDVVEAGSCSGCLLPAEFRSGKGGVGNAENGTLKAEPISLSVSLRARTCMLGAIAGTCEVGLRGIFEPLEVEGQMLRPLFRAERRRSSTMVFSSRIASSTVSGFDLRCRLFVRSGRRSCERERERPLPAKGDGLRRRIGELKPLLRTCERDCGREDEIMSSSAAGGMVGVL